MSFTDSMTKVSIGILPSVKAWFQAQYEDTPGKQQSPYQTQSKPMSDEAIRTALGIAFDIGRDRVLGKEKTIDAIIGDLSDVKEDIKVEPDVCNWRVKTFEFDSTSCGYEVPHRYTHDHTHCGRCGKFILFKYSL